LRKPKCPCFWHQFAGILALTKMKTCWCKTAVILVPNLSHFGAKMQAIWCSLKCPNCK
jgi:hypothetical protein